MTFSRLALPSALLMVAGAASAGTTVNLIRGASTDPQTSIVGGDLVTNVEIDDALNDDGEGEDAGPIQVEGHFAKAVLNRAVTAFSEAAARDASDSRLARTNSTVINSFTECLSGQSQFDGTDTNNNRFAVQVADNGDPGAGRDNFSISGSDQNGVSYSNSGLLGGGNIQDHGFRCH